MTHDEAIELELIHDIRISLRDVLRHIHEDIPVEQGSRHLWDAVDDAEQLLNQFDKDKELKENPYIFNPTTGAVTFVSPRSLELAEFCQSLASLDNDDGDLKLLD